MDISILCEQFCDYSVSFKGQSKATIRRYRYVLSAFCRFTGATTLEEITDASVRQLFYDGRVQRKWSTNTYIVYHVTLKMFFRWCMKQGYLVKSPVEGIEIPKLEKRVAMRLTKQDALRLLEISYNYPYVDTFLRYRNHAIFSTFIFAGLRKQELLNLKYADVDIENLTLFVRQGKGNKDRIIPMSFPLAQSLKRYMTERKKRQRTCAEFFVSSNRNHRYTENGLKLLVIQMSTALGLKLTVHKLRHTFATLMLEGGCDIYSLSKMMGHGDIKITTLYLAASIEHLRPQIGKHPLNNLTAC